MNYATYYQDQLYPLQDKVLKIIGEVAPDFYLTGGTALSRFYLYHRFSEDLDLFVNRDEQFSGKVNKTAEAFRQHFQKIRIQLSDTDFLRVIVEDIDVALKVEFINDVGYHYCNKENRGGWQLDSWQNILSNKVCALSRNAAKDYADILFLSLKYPFSWVDVYDAAKLKDTWVNEITSAQLIDVFDIQRLSDINWIDEQMDIKIFKNDFHTIAKDILMAADNSLCKDQKQ